MDSETVVGTLRKLDAWFQTLDEDEQAVIAELVYRVLLAEAEVTGHSYAKPAPVTPLGLRFTLFLEDGTPCRAVMDTVWKKFTEAEEPHRGTPRQ